MVEENNKNNKNNKKKNKRKEKSNKILQNEKNIKIQPK